ARVSTFFLRRYQPLPGPLCTRRTSCRHRQEGGPEMDQVSRPTVDLHCPNEIVVERDHVRSVIHELPDFGVKVTESQEDLRLGLARLKLDGAAATTELASADVPV